MHVQRLNLVSISVSLCCPCPRPAHLLRRAARGAGQGKSRRDSSPRATLHGRVQGESPKLGAWRSPFSIFCATNILVLIPGPGAPPPYLYSEGLGPLSWSCILPTPTDPESMYTSNYLSSSLAQGSAHPHRRHSPGTLNLKTKSRVCPLPSILSATVSCCSWGARPSFSQPLQD